MKVSKRSSKYAVLGAVIVVVTLAFAGFFNKKKQGVTVDVRVPELSAAALRGKVAFDTNCAQCHGVNGSGTGNGPPLIHNIYNPGHHSDQAFFIAARRGVRQHHWPYGNMPKQPQVTEEQIAAIVKYVRELQTANGIVSRPHRM